MISHTRREARADLLCAAGILLLLVLTAVSLGVGKYPLSLSKILSGDPMQVRVFLTLRLSRTAAGILFGFVLGVAGFVYQTVFHNPLASPDIIGVSSGAGAGAAFGILFLSGSIWTTVSAFAGAMTAVVLTLALSGLDRSGKNGTIVLAGIAVHALAQTVLMCLKLTADPERELASIEYWLMGSLSGIHLSSLTANAVICAAALVFLFLLHRQILLLSGDAQEAAMLGVSVGKLRLAVLLLGTLAVSAVISMAGLIGFVGLLAPHFARMLTGENSQKTMALSGITGACLLCGADILARSAAQTELPVSIFTSVLGAPFLVYLIVRDRRRV